MKSGKRKTRDTDNQEDWLGDVSGCTGYEDAAWLCSINGGIHKNQIINERLAWNVIDKPGLTDEAGLERRRQFRRKHIIHVCIVCAVFAIFTTSSPTAPIIIKNPSHVQKPEKINLIKSTFTSPFQNSFTCSAMTGGNSSNLTCARSFSSRSAAARQ